MQQIRPCVYFSFFVICALISLSIAISVRGEEVQNRCAIHGTVIDMTPDISEEAFARFEHAASAEEALAPLEGIIMGCGARSNVVVRLRGDSITRKTITDSKGKFDFWELPAGTYEISTEAPAHPSSAGKKRTAIGKMRITVGLGMDKQVWTHLNVYAYSVAVRGRITDADGKPVAGAKVTGIPVSYRDMVGNPVPDDQFLERQFDSSIVTVSSADGFYELQGFGAPNVYWMARYLCGDDQLSGFYVEIHVKAAGFVQSKENVPRVPLVSEELLVPARRVMKWLISKSEFLSEQEKQEFRERETPSSHGNTITGINIVLKKAGDAEKQNGK